MFFILQVFLGLICVSAHHLVLNAFLHSGLNGMLNDMRFKLLFTDE